MRSSEQLRFARDQGSQVLLVLAGSAWTITEDSLLAFASAAMAFVAVAAIFGPMWRRARLDGRSLLVGGLLYLVYLGLVLAAILGILPIG